MEIYERNTVSAPVKGMVEVPGSKSMTNRALFLAALAEGTTVLKGVLFSDDSRSFLGCLKSLGFEVWRPGTVSPCKGDTVIVRGMGGAIPNRTGTIHVGSAGTAARFLTAMLALSDGSYTILASDQMKARPMKTLFDSLTQLGASFVFLEREGFLPVRVMGRGYQKAKKDAAASQGEETKRNQLDVSVDISKSTQFLSALMMAAPMLGQTLAIHITSEKKDGSYIRITRTMMEEYGCHVIVQGDTYTIPGGQHYRAGTYGVEPDVSAACYFWAAAVLTGGQVLVRNVHASSMQGDMKFLGVLEQMGAVVTDQKEGICVTGPKDGVYPGVHVDMNDFSDQTMTLAALAPFAGSKTEIRNIAHIRFQESNRIRAIVTELTRMGISCREEEDGIVIEPGMPKHADILTYDDHRMAMAFALIGLRAPGIRICNPSCCRKTFDQYFSVLDELTGREAVLFP